MKFAFIPSRIPHKLLLATTAMTSVLVATAAPNAADINFTINNTGPIVLETLRGGGGTVDIAAGVTLSNATITPTPTNFAFSETLSGLTATGTLTTSRWTITNAGTVDNIAPFGPFTSPNGTFVGQVVPRAINISGGQVINLAGANITSTGDGVLIGSPTAATQPIMIDNAGLIRGASFRGIGAFDPGGTVQTIITNRSTGRIESGGTAIVAGSNNTVVDNAGLIQGVNLSSPANLSTTARISDGRLLRDVFGPAGYGVVIGGGTITNRAGATISGATASGILIGAAINGVPSYFADARFGVGTVVNDGAISSGPFAAIGATRSAIITNNATGIISSINGNAIVAGTGYNLNNPQLPSAFTMGAASSLINSGTINAGRVAVQFYNGGSVTNNASGRIIAGGGGFAAYGPSIVTNRGQIQTTRGAGVVIDAAEIGGASLPAPGVGVVNIINSGVIAGGSQTLVGPANLETLIRDLDLLTQDIDLGRDEFPLGVGVIVSAENEPGPVSNANALRIVNEAGGMITGGFAAFASATSEISSREASSFLAPNVLVLDNSGTMRATTAGIGVLILGNGTLNNNVGGTIAGASLGTTMGLRTIGVLITDTGIVTNAGTIMGDVSLGALSTLTNSGAINGAVEFIGPGNNTVTLRTGSMIDGPVDAGAGTDTLALEGSGIAANTFSNFESLVMRGTEWTLTGSSTFGSVNVQSGFLTVNGQLTNGAGAVTLGANSGLRGVGRVMNSVSNTGGTVAPAGAGTFGTLTIQGDYTQGATGRLIVDANDAGSADRLTVTGRATLGGTLQIASVDGAWSTQRTYTILSATSGVTGTFATVEQNLAYLTPQLTYGASDVTLALSRQTEEIQQAITQETTEQTISTSTRKTTATVESRIDQVIAIAFPIVAPAPAPSPSTPPSAPSEPSATPGQDNNGQRQEPQQQSMSDGAARGLSAGDEMSGWGLWATVSPTYVNQDLVLPGQTGVTRVKGHTWDLFVGADKLVGERAVVGAVVGYEDTSYDLKTNGGERQATGPMVVGYAGVLFTDWLYATGQVTQAWFDNDLAEATFGGPLVRGEFDSRRTTGSISLTARHAIEKVNLAGKIGYSYTRERFEAYTTSDNAAVGSDRTRLGRLTIGGEALYRGDKLMPYVNATFERDVNPPRGPGDIEGLVLGGGFRYLGGRFTVDAYGNAETGRAGESAVTLGLNVRFTF